MSDQELQILELLSTGPRWGAEIAERVGLTAWSQIPTGIIYGRRLVKKGLATERLQSSKPFGKKRVYFYITDAGIREFQKECDEIVEVRR